MIDLSRDSLKQWTFSHKVSCREIQIRQNNPTNLLSPQGYIDSMYFNIKLILDAMDLVAQLKDSEREYHEDYGVKKYKNWFGFNFVNHHCYDVPSISKMENPKGGWN